jgi:formylglycine-generating enzyme required for sulfatase activity
MRYLSMTLLGIITASTVIASEPAYPLSDGQEPITEYAKRTGLEPTKTLDLGKGVKLELVLIPAGKFTMGTEDLPPFNGDRYRKKIVTGQAILLVGVGAVMFLFGVVVIRAIRKRQRPQYSLAWLLAMTISTGVGMLGGADWYFSARGFDAAKAEYAVTVAQYRFEKPAHEVTLIAPFYLGKYEVTQEQFAQVIGANPSYFKGQDLPVEQVTWDDAQKFCKKVGQQTMGLTVRLPSEAEWEYACRTGTRTLYHSGNDETSLAQVAWYEGNAKNTTHSVGEKGSNAFGLYDMHGNVCEWCGDLFHQSYNGAPIDGQEWVDPLHSGGRAVRGGCWCFDFVNCRSASRYGHMNTTQNNCIGFRVVAVPPLSSALSSPRPEP